MKEKIEIMSVDADNKESKTQSRSEQIKNLIRTGHLNDEEKKAVLNICERYKDIFHLEGESLTSEQ